MFFRSFRNPIINITTDAARDLISNNPDLLILDVRTKPEFDQGHIKNAKLIPYNMLPIRIKEIGGYIDKPVLVYCQSGGRSQRAVGFLQENGFKQIYNMYSGFGNWKYEIER